MRTVLLLAMLMGTVESAGASDLAMDPRTTTLSWELLKAARYGYDSKEHAAFIVRTESGKLELVHWPFEAEALRATYRGTVPAGAVAIVHTHPNDLPNPSPGDVALARKLALPVFVLTRTSITRTDGARAELVARGDWNPSR